ncbi:MAG TPA: CoA transferase [Dehalococcoidia bacterium]|jgi:crotonobetainyl-CoA:carnitine CoA-transferase CaiB-like acyl-CoA transferase
MSKAKDKSQEQVLVRYGISRRERQQFLAGMMSPEGKPEVLSDVVVLDASYANFSGIIAASLFAEFGAEVIKIEPPDGDPARKMTPYGAKVNGVGIPFLMEARNKKYLELDLTTAVGRKDFKKLAAKADILIETYPAGQMDEWGIGYRQLIEANPGLIYTAITPYGQYTDRAKEFRNVPDSDITSQAASGLAANIGDPDLSPEPYNWPFRAGAWIGWYISGLEAALGGAIALIYKADTGEGQMIDVASADAYASMVGYPVFIGYTWEKARPRLGKHDFTLYPYGFWKSKDGIVAIAAPRDHDFRALLKILKMWKIEDDWRFTFDRITDMLDQIEKLYNLIEAETVKYTSDELIGKALQYSIKAARSKWRGGGVPIIMKVPTPSEAMQNPHWKIRNSFQEIDDKKLGKFIIPANFIKMSESPPRVKWISCDIGQDNKYIRNKYLSD